MTIDAKGMAAPRPVKVGELRGSQWEIKSGLKAGDRVKAGSEVARVGNSGATPVPHLHYELRTGYGIRNVRGLPAYFRGFELVGAPAPAKPVALTTGDVVIVK